LDANSFENNFVQLDPILQSRHYGCSQWWSSG